MVGAWKEGIELQLAAVDGHRFIGLALHQARGGSDGIVRPHGS